jgi:hypothetical protein
MAEDSGAFKTKQRIRPKSDFVMKREAAAKMPQHSENRNSAANGPSQMPIL